MILLEVEIIILTEIILESHSLKLCSNGCLVHYTVDQCIDALSAFMSAPASLLYIIAVGEGQNRHYK